MIMSRTKTAEKKKKKKEKRNKNEIEKKTFFISFVGLLVVRVNL